MLDDLVRAAIGGAMIGAAAALLLLANGRIAGVSGIVGSFLPPAARDRGWRWAFLAGLVGAGIVGAVVAPAAIGPVERSTGVVLIAGILVGFGTRMGGGCTSGHGVCGMSRLSPRSIAATATFVAIGMLTVWIAGAAR
jgi:uncharacterized membrane protein YedE/YeeE